MATVRTHAAKSNGKSTAARTRGTTQTRQTREVQPTRSPYANALEQMLPQREVIRLSVVECLRDLTGKRFVSQYRVEGRKFDWNAFNEQFRADYGDLSTKDLMAYAREKFGIESLEEIRELRSRQKAVRNDRVKALGGANYSSAETTEFEDGYIDLNNDLDID